MKTKRSGYHQKPNQLGKKKQVNTPQNASEATDDAEDKKTENSCGDGCCAIRWKPASVAR